MSEQFIYLKDSVSSCHSIIMHMKLSEYLTLIKNAYDQAGNISGQRNALISASAKKVRIQMMKDFQKGSVLPPVVLGLVDKDFSGVTTSDIDKFINYINDSKDEICIIDGMQRSTAMYEASITDPDRYIRVEFWIADSTSDLIYRMLVLNTGQVPWNTKRQLEVVLKPIIKEINHSIDNIKLIESNDKIRRNQGGVFQADKVIESFLIFGARSEKANKKDAIANEYSKLEFIESSSKQEILSVYIELLSRFVRLDMALSNCKETDLTQNFKFKKGLDFMSSQPFLIGLTVSFAIKILGRPKQDYSAEKQQQNLERILEGFDTFLDMLEQLQNKELDTFLSLDTLDECLPSSTSSRIGDVERDFFRSAFNVLIEEDFEIDNMDICWSN